MDGRIVGVTPPPEDATTSAITSTLGAILRLVVNASIAGPPAGDFTSDVNYVTTASVTSQSELGDGLSSAYRGHGTLRAYHVGTPSHIALYQGTTDLYSLSNATDVARNDTSTLESGHGALGIVVVSILVTILAFVTAGGNLLVMISFKMDKQLQTVSNYFLFSLSVADFFIGIVSMPLYTVYLLMDRWPLGSIVCDTWLSLDYTMSNASVANLLLISFDRYFSVTRPLTYRAKRTPRRAAIMITCAWAISSVLWTPWIFAWPYIEGERTVPNDECYIQFLTTNQYITVITAILAFYMPVIIMCILYFKIYIETENRQKGLAKLQATSGLSDKRYGDSSDDDDVRVSLSHKGIRSDSSPELEDVLELNDALGRHRRKRTCWQKMRNCCKIDKDEDYNEDSSSSNEPGSPGYGTPSSSHSHHHIIPIRRDQSVHAHQNGKHHHHQHRKNSASGLMIPLITVDSNRSTPTATPSTELTGTFSRHSQLSSSTAMTRFSDGDDKKEAKKDKDMYTILIKLPDTTTDPHAKPSIRMITDSEEDDETRALNEKEDPERVPLASERKRPNMDGKKQGSQESQGENAVPPRRMSNTTDSVRLAMQARVAAKLATKVKTQRLRRRNQERKQEKKAAKTLSAILLAFIVTWTPYNIFTVIQTFCSDACINSTLYAIGYWLCYINSTINPVCYALCNANFRRTYWRILSCTWAKRNQRAPGIRAGLYESTTFTTHTTGSR